MRSIRSSRVPILATDQSVAGAPRAWPARPRITVGRQLAAVIVLGLISAPVNAQAVRVVVVDSSSAAPLSDVLVSLLDTAGEVIGMRRGNDRGVSWLTVPSAGHFAVLVYSPGYRHLVSNWLAVGDTDTLEVTFRLSAVAQSLSRVVIAAQMDSVAPLLPLGINAKTIAGRVIMPAEIAAHSMGARDYIDVLGSTGAADFIITYFGGGRCITSTRRIRRPTMNGPLCARVYVNNMRADAGMAIDLATPENLDFAVWLRSIDAGVLYGSALPGEDESVLLLYTKDYRRTHTIRRD